MNAIKYQNIKTKTMKTKGFSDYLAPQVDVVKISAEGILCVSTPDGIGVDNMDIITGGKGTDWDWE
jgi:hypothetical protein